MTPFALAAPAQAGYYTVTGTCGTWSAWGSPAINVGASCPTLVAQNWGGAGPAPVGTAGGWRFDPPAGTAVYSANLQGTLVAGSGWQTSVYTEGISAREFVGCPGLTCPGASATLYGDYPAYNSGDLVIRVRCGSTNGC
ncbi:MAG TPA: hypothetical protein VMB50_03490, partial [Myxococcales bacterium]|nr:hypothetical protein [Myxococcales bacterium]